MSQPNPNMTPEELRLRLIWRIDKYATHVAKHGTGYFEHYTEDMAIIDDILQLFTDLCNEVIGPKYQIPSDGIAWDALRHANQEHEVQVERLSKLTGKEI